MYEKKEREKKFREALMRLYPQMPLLDAVEAAQRHNKRKIDKYNLYCSADALARHKYTNYNELCPQGCGEETKQAARRAVRQKEKEILRSWGGPDRDPG